MARRRRPPRSGALTELPPLKIFSQIVALQAIYYLTATVLTLFISLVSGTKFSFDLVFGWRDVRADYTAGWVWAMIWVLDGGVVVAMAIIALISRSKLVPDFALSLHLIHLVVVTLYSSSTASTYQLPAYSFWWFTMAASSALSVGLGMWGCRYRELRPLAFGGLLGGGGGGSSTNTAGGLENGMAGGADGGGGGDEEQGPGRGRGRGRERDGNGEYEMVGMSAGGDLGEVVR